MCSSQHAGWSWHPNSFSCQMHCIDLSISKLPNSLNFVSRRLWDARSRFRRLMRGLSWRRHRLPSLKRRLTSFYCWYLILLISSPRSSSYLQLKFFTMTWRWNAAISVCLRRCKRSPIPTRLYTRCGGDWNLYIYILVGTYLGNLWSSEINECAQHQ